MNVLQTSIGVDELKTRLRDTWMAGDYGRFSRYMERDAEAFYRRLPIKRGAQLLDVGCGAGQLSLIAARSGARVTGCDIANNWLAQARRSAAAEGLCVEFEEGDAEALPYGNGTFDAVVSLIAAMFAPRPERVAAELTRVCRPGGIIAMANWTAPGFVGQMFKTIAKHIAPSGMPSPLLWGDEPTVRDRLKSGVATLECSRHLYELSYPFSPADVVEFFRANYGPMTRAFASIEEEGQRQLRQDLIDLWSRHNRATDGTTRVDAEYLQVVAVRGNDTVN
jgi:ubiquinone/menaquinone biosynthesis C-methylase UbiE